MTPILEAARDLQAFLTERQWKFCIIGVIALLRWGEPRFTRDVDVTLLSGFGREDEFIDRKSTRLNSSHLVISYAVFCLKKKKIGSMPRGRFAGARCLMLP